MCRPGRALCLGQVSHVGNEPKPARMPGAAGVEARMLHFGGRGPCAVALAEVAVKGGQLLAIARLADQGSQDVECLKVIGHLAARGELDQLVVQSLQRQPQSAIACAHFQQGPELGKENPVIADIVGDRRMRLFS